MSTLSTPTGTRITRNLAAAAVAAIAAWSSYSHMTHVALRFGERPEVAYLLPLSVDGLMVVASVAMVDDKRSGHKVRRSARLAFAVGIIASLAANMAAAQPTLGARITAAWPALALLLTVELLSRSGRRAVAEVPPPAEVPPAQVPPQVPPAVQVPPPAHVPPAAVVPPQVPPQRRRRPAAQTRELAAAVLEREPDLNRAQLAGHLGITARQLRKVLPAAQTTTTPPQMNGRRRS